MPRQVLLYLNGLVVDDQPFFFSCLAARFSFKVLVGFFFSSFFESMPLLMLLSAMWTRW